MLSQLEEFPFFYGKMKRLIQNFPFHAGMPAEAFSG
jgi:hypothetical protein